MSGLRTLSVTSVSALLRFSALSIKKNVIVLFNQLYRNASRDDVLDFTFFDLVLIGLDALICLSM